MTSLSDYFEEKDENGGALALTPIEARVLACLMEKELAVPDSYPLTLNSLTLACNQKSNREPVMKITEGEVGHASNTLQDRDLVKVEYGGRTKHFMHNARRTLNLDNSQQALLTVMMLRAPQTLNDFKVRTKRMVSFADNDDILLTLESLNERESPLMQHIAKGRGQREDRYTHLLCGEVEFEVPQSQPESPPVVAEPGLTILEQKVEALTKRVEALENLLNVQQNSI